MTPDPRAPWLPRDEAQEALLDVFAEDARRQPYDEDTDPLAVLWDDERHCDAWWGWMS